VLFAADAKLLLRRNDYMEPLSQARARAQHADLFSEFSLQYPGAVNRHRQKRQGD
jgi:hypothetical protein